MIVDPSDMVREQIGFTSQAVYLVLFENGLNIKDRIWRVCQAFNSSCQEVSRFGLEE